MPPSDGLMFSTRLLGRLEEVDLARVEQRVDGGGAGGRVDVGHGRLQRLVADALRKLGAQRQDALGQRGGGELGLDRGGGSRRRAGGRRHRGALFKAYPRYQLQLFNFNSPWEVTSSRHLYEKLCNGAMFSSFRMF